jgi:hypothetical protein
MSSLIFPYNTPGIQFDYLRYYVPATLVQQAMSGIASTLALRAFPLVHFEYSFEFLQDSNGGPAPLGLQNLVGFMNQVGGRFDTFLHSDPDFNTITPADAAVLGIFGVVTSGVTSYQLLATYQNAGGPGAAELVQNLNGAPILYANGTTISPSTYTIGATGIVTFIELPTVGATLTWSGSFFYRCRLDDDHYDVTKIMKGLWKLEKIAFTSMTL